MRNFVPSPLDELEVSEGYTGGRFRGQVVGKHMNVVHVPDGYDERLASCGCDVSPCSAVIM